MFSVTGANPAATCTATETVPAGYTVDQSGCVGLPLGSSCTINNSLIGSFTAIPTLSEWAMIILIAILTGSGVAAMRVKTRRSRSP